MTSTRAELEALHCWEAGDRVPRPGDDEVPPAPSAAAGSVARGEGCLIVSQPVDPKPGRRSTLGGSRLPLAYARETGANFLTPPLSQRPMPASIPSSLTRRSTISASGRTCCRLLCSPSTSPGTSPPISRRPLRALPRPARPGLPEQPADARRRLRTRAQGTLTWPRTWVVGPDLRRRS